MKPLSIAVNISKSLADSSGSAANLNYVMSVLAAEIGAVRTFALEFKVETGKLTPIASHGLNAWEFRKLEQRADESSLRKIADGVFMWRSFELASDQALNFLGEIPGQQLNAAQIRYGQNVLGVICAEFTNQSIHDENAVSEILSLVGTMIAQSLNIGRAAIFQQEKLLEENTHLRQELKEKYDFSHIIGNSSPMKQVYDQVTQVARSNAPILLRGESGTGKELIANAIHYNSLRGKRPFVKVNCASLPETVIDAELFGYEKGAFPSAARLKKGRIEAAEGGTLFLEEIGGLPMQMQPKVLRILQEHEFERLGGLSTYKTNLRIITATSRNLENAIRLGQFREDLYYRLSAFTIHLPPLRDRKSDILLLAEHFLEKYERVHGKNVRRISTPAIDMLTAYHFPGNVRELENAIERAVLACDSKVIHGHHLPPTLQTAEVSDTVTNVTLVSAVASFERDLIQDALKSNGGNVARAAKQLNSTERILSYKIKKYGIDTIRFRRWTSRNFS